MKQVKALKQNDEYTLTVEFLTNEKMSMNFFQIMFEKQKQNLKSMSLNRVLLFPDYFRLFSEKCW